MISTCTYQCTERETSRNRQTKNPRKKIRDIRKIACGNGLELTEVKQEDMPMI